MTPETASPLGVLRVLQEVSASRLMFEPASQGKNAYVLTGSIRGAVTIHASNAVTAWWGLAESVLQRMIAQNLLWAAILLDRDNAHGYVWAGDELKSGIAVERWTFQDKSGRHFKFQRPPDFRGSYRFQSPSELLGILRVVLDGSEP